MNKKLIPYILSLSLIIPSVLAATPTVKSGLTGFANGMKGLLRGNMGAFVDGLLAAAPVIGLFVIVFGLMFFITKITLFKDEAHSKYARMIAIGIGLVGIAQQSVFNAILNWSTTFLTLAFILAMVFMFIIFLNYSRKSHYEMNKGMFNAQGEFFAAKSDSRKAKRDLSKVTHELEMDEKLYSKTERDLDSLNSDLQDITKLYGDELRQVDHLAELLRKATASADRGENNQVHGYVQALTRDLGSLVTTMQHESHDATKAHELLNHIRKNLAYAFKDEKEELSEENHLRKIIKRHLEHHQEMHGYDSDKVAKLENHLYQEGTSMHKHLLAIRTAAKQLKDLEDRIERHTEEMNKFGYQAKHDTAGAVRDAAMTNDFSEAHKQLDHLRSLIEQGRKQAGNIGYLEQEMRQLVSQIENHERALTILVADIKASFEREVKIDKSKFAAEKDALKSMLGHKKEVTRLLESLMIHHKKSPFKAHYDAFEGQYDSFKSEVEHALSLMDDSGSDLDKRLKSYLNNFESIKIKANTFGSQISGFISATTVDPIRRAALEEQNYAKKIKDQSEAAIADAKKLAKKI